MKELDLKLNDKDNVEISVKKQQEKEYILIGNIISNSYYFFYVMYKIIIFGNYIFIKPKQ